MRINPIPLSSYRGALPFSCFFFQCGLCVLFEIVLCLVSQLYISSCVFTGCDVVYAWRASFEPWKHGNNLALSGYTRHVPLPIPNRGIFTAVRLLTFPLALIWRLEWNTHKCVLESSRVWIGFCCFDFGVTRPKREQYFRWKPTPSHACTIVGLVHTAQLIHFNFLVPAKSTRRTQRKWI